MLKKFSNYYDIEHLYLNNYKDKNFTQIIYDINNLIKLKKIEIVVFDVDYFKFINLFFIKEINSKKKILWTGDDFELHEMNSITASGCDLILSHCPLSVLKYKEKGYQAYILQGEKGERVENFGHEKKEIDVLFFGTLTPDRKEILNYIKNEGISLKNVGHEEKDSKSEISEKKMLELISKSKIVINFSKSRTSLVSSYGSESIYKFFYQFKGRIMLAGLNGAACVSEYSPGQELLFTEDEVPTFYLKEDCVSILKKLLNNDELLSKYTNKLASKVYNLSDDKKSFEPIFNAIEKLNHKRVELITIPYWYLRIIAKQIILRNLKLSTLIKSVLQFKLIFEVVQNTNFFKKFLVILESVINILWYSFILTFKSKK